MVDCDLRSFDADTIFIAEVICIVELTELIRVLTSLRFAMIVSLS